MKPLTAGKKIDGGTRIPDFQDHGNKKPA